MTPVMAVTAKSGSSDCERRWRSRVRRAQELEERHRAAADPLRLYEIVLGFQSELASDFGAPVRPDVPLRGQIDLTVASLAIPSLLALVMKHGPEALSLHARGLRQSGETSWLRILDSALANEPDQNALNSFLARACLQPMAENIQTQLPANKNYGKPLCPACGGLPQLVVLRPEGEGASRWLLCSFCLREWLFRRIVCPWCGEEDKEKLPQYSAEECGHVMVEGCDTCKKYLKAVDMTRDGHAEPLVDEAALAVLDVWAVDHGYAKIVQNLIGF
jgi:FdhE protein